MAYTVEVMYLALNLTGKNLFSGENVMTNMKKTVLHHIPSKAI